MILYLIKILAITLVTVCCIFAAYTDVKRQVIPNRLTFPIIIIGLSLVSFFYFQIGEYNLYYYISIIIIFIVSYILWYFGVWAGGDVKLFTAISTLLIPEFLDIIPEYTIFNIHLPFNLAYVGIPTLVVMLNSILSIIPVVMLIVLFRIIKDKHYLIDDLMKTFNFKEVVLSLNSLIISYLIISLLNVHYLILKIIFLIIMSYFVSKIMKNEKILIVLTITIIIQQFVTGNIFIYLEELFLITILSLILKIYSNGIVKEALTDYVEKNKLEEGMILAYPISKINDNYCIEKTNLKSFINYIGKENDTKEVICKNQAGGLTYDEISLINKIDEINLIPIKKGLSFAPFILVGLCLTFLIGNTWNVLRILLGLI